MRTNPMSSLLRYFRAALFACGALATLPAAAQPVPPQAPAAAVLSQGQVLYLPIYSHIYHGDVDKEGKPQQTLLSAHVSVRNSDPNVALKVLYARYHDTAGRLIKDYLPQAGRAGTAIVPPLGTLELFVPRGDTSGGSGANFLIAWHSDEPAQPPVVEALHGNVQPARTIIFITVARPLASNAPAVTR